MEETQFVSEETTDQESEPVDDHQEETPVDHMAALKDEVDRLKGEIQELKNLRNEFVESEDTTTTEDKEVASDLDRIVGDFEGGRYRDAFQTLLNILQTGSEKGTEVVAGGAIERESFVNARGLEDLRGKVDVAMELRRHGVPRADVVRLLRASAAKPEKTRVEEPSARVSRPVDENRIIEGYWKKALG